MDEGSKQHGAEVEHLGVLPLHTRPRTPFDAALHALLELTPRTGLDGIRDGRRSAMLAALDNRATWKQIRHWRRGTNRPPLWAIEMLKRKLARRQEGSERGLAELERVA